MWMQPWYWCSGTYYSGKIGGGTKLRPAAPRASVYHHAAKLRPPTGSISNHARYGPSPVCTTRTVKHPRRPHRGPPASHHSATSRPAQTHTGNEWRARIAPDSRWTPGQRLNEPHEGVSAHRLRSTKRGWTSTMHSCRRSRCPCLATEPPYSHELCESDGMLHGWSLLLLPFVAAAVTTRPAIHGAHCLSWHLRL